MIIKIVSFAVVLGLVAGVCCAATPAEVVNAVPPSCELGQYPNLDRPVTASEQAMMGLKPSRLPESITAPVWDGKAYPYRTILAGTLVLADAEGTVRYVLSCGNRVCAQKAQLIAKSAPPATQKPRLRWLWRIADAHAKALGEFWRWVFFQG